MGNKASMRILADLSNGMEVERPVKSSRGSNSTHRARRHFSHRQNLRWLFRYLATRSRSAAADILPISMNNLKTQIDFTAAECFVDRGNDTKHRVLCPSSPSPYRGHKALTLLSEDGPKFPMTPRGLCKEILASRSTSDPDHHDLHNGKIGLFLCIQLKKRQRAT